MSGRRITKLPTTTGRSATCLVEEARMWYGCYRHITGPEANKHVGCGITAVGLGFPSVRGLRYKVTIEMVGANPLTPPEPEDYMPNWATKEDEKRAKHHMRSPRERRVHKAATPHMKAVLQARKDGKAAYKWAMNEWRKALSLPKSEAIDWDTKDAKRRGEAA